MYDDQYYAPRNPLTLCAIALAIGIVATAAYLAIESPNYAAVLAGAIGLFFGSYSMSYANRIGGENKWRNIVVAVVGEALSVIAFMLGLAGLM
ncbi:MAG: hypothetical protein LBS92_02430 [Candidatus Methanoplasma sp.]|jgi:hypothetical protein|nr:hypothetical protein [Candidatus Methanoplasma sp.]